MTNIDLMDRDIGKRIRILHIGTDSKEIATGKLISFNEKFVRVKFNNGDSKLISVNAIIDLKVWEGDSK
ncbi:MAG: hypothetical protein KKH88_02095 [Nanoarchaeota archaeon]|nr:hypothetical protein [Nanoarchaeota archaeon]